jgi:phage shock protein A
MALITRLSRLMRADLNALLDRLEEPDILLAQALRDMQQTLADDARTLAAMTRERQQLRQRRETLSQRNTAASRGARALSRCRAGRPGARPAPSRSRTGATGRAARPTRTRPRQPHPGPDRDPESTPPAAGSAPRPGKPVRQRAEPNDEPAGSLADDALAPIQDAEVEIALLAAKRRRSS